MILSEHMRRWTEIKYYYFCLDIYHINRDMIEVILVVEAVAHIGHLNYKLLKTITGKMLGDPYYLPIKEEAISFARLYGIPISTVTKEFGITKKTVSNIVKNPKRNMAINPVPLLTIEEDQEIYKFCELLPKLQKAGIHEKEKRKD